MSTSLCLLTLNELAGCQRDVPQLPRDEFAEVFAVDGGSTDGTVAYLQSQGITVIRQQRPGLNGAHWDALDHCRTEHLIFFHPKGTTPPADTLKVKAALEAGHELVIASRNIAGARNEEDTHWFRPRKWFSTLLAWLAAARWRREGPMIRDVLHGFRGVRVASFRAMNPPLTGFTIDLALVVAAYRQRRKRCELPTVETQRLQGETHFKALPTGWKLLGYFAREAVTPRVWLALIALAAGVGHLWFGSYYWAQWTTQHRSPSCPPQEATGEEYLRLFTGWDTDWERDAAAYNRAALGVLATGVPRSRDGTVYWRAPVYPYFLAMSYRLGGVRHRSVAIGQAVLTVIACVFVGLAAYRLAGRSKAMLGAALLYAVNLRFAMYVGYVSPTSLLLALMAVALWAVPRFPHAASVAAFTAAFALGTLAQAQFFIIASAAALWLLLQRQRLTRLAGLVLLAVVGLKVAASLGAADAQARLDRGVLWEGNNPAYAGFRLWDGWAQRLTPLPADADSQRAAWQWIRENPGQYATLCVVRLRAALGPFTSEMSARHRGIAAAMWLLVFPAAAMALWLRRRQPAAQLVLIGYAAYVIFAALVIEDWYLRYRIPLEVMLTAFAGTVWARQMES